MASIYREQNEDPQYWFNLKKLKVEVGLLAPAKYRVGPFETREQAQDALKTLRERSQTWSKSEEDD